MSTMMFTGSDSVGYAVCAAAAPESSTGSSTLDELAFNKKPRPVEFEPYKMVRRR